MQYILFWLQSGFPNVASDTSKLKPIEALNFGVLMLNLIPFAGDFYLLTSHPQTLKSGAQISHYIILMSTKKSERVSFNFS